MNSRSKLSLSRARKLFCALMLAILLYYSGSLFVTGLGMEFVSRGTRNEALIIEFGPIAFLPTVLIGVLFRRVGSALLAGCAVISSIALRLSPYSRQSCVGLFIDTQLPMFVAAGLLYWMRDVKITDLLSDSSRRAVDSN